MKALFNAQDELLQQLVEARREHVISQQKRQAAALLDLDARGRERIARLRKSLSKDMVAVIDTLDKDSDADKVHTLERVKGIQGELAKSAVPQEQVTAVHPGLAGGHLIAPSSLGWFTPYYGVLHGSNGTVVWQGYNPGNIDLWDSASGGGSGIFGTGAAEFTFYMDWWFSYVPTANRNYAHTIYVPFHGFYILYADDGFWDSKEARARIDLSAAGYQYNWKAGGSTNVFDMGSQNINANDRFDGWRTMYYSDLLGADRAYLRVTAAFNVYARGGGSQAQLNFSDGNANYMGIPWVYVD